MTLIASFALPLAFCSVFLAWSFYDFDAPANELEMEKPYDETSATSSSLQSLVSPQATFTSPVATSAALGVLALGGLSKGSRTFDSGNIACFSGDSLVVTREGEKRMEDLRIGDEVLSRWKSQQLSYSPVTSFMHRMPLTETKFLRIETKCGSFIKMTPQHLIFVLNKHHSNHELVLASDVSIGDKLIRINNDYEMYSATVKNITIVHEIGAYAPLTMNGELVVNNLVVSCHSVVKLPELQQGFFEGVRRMESIFWTIFGKEASQNDEGFVDVPTGTWHILNALEYLIPSAHLWSD